MTQQFKIGNLTVNSGGIGPDDYLAKRNGGKWHRIIIRHIRPTTKEAQQSFWHSAA